MGINVNCVTVRETACSRTSRADQCAKIEEICKSLVACRLIALDDQAQALGLSRSTTWTLLRGVHKCSGLSAATVNKILSAPRLPPTVRVKVLEYVAEKLAGKYGDRPHRLKAYARRLDPRHLLASSLEVSTVPIVDTVEFSARRAQSNSTGTKSGNQAERGNGGLV
jgi:predicted DNA-binding transcriptional regulator AlpA